MWPEHTPSERGPIKVWQRVYREFIIGLRMQIPIDQVVRLAHLKHGRGMPLTMPRQSTQKLDAQANIIEPEKGQTGGANIGFLRQFREQFFEGGATSLKYRSKDSLKTPPPCGDVFLVVLVSPAGLADVGAILAFSRVRNVRVGVVSRSST
jgi:hypothetical protein